MRITVTCINRIRDKNNNIVGYVLMDDYGRQRNVAPHELKGHMKNNRLKIRNLKLTSDNRIIEVDIKGNIYEAVSNMYNNNKSFETYEETNEKLGVTKIDTSGNYKEEDHKIPDIRNMDYTYTGDNMFNSLIDKYLGGNVTDFEDSLLEMCDEIMFEMKKDVDDDLEKTGVTPEMIFKTMGDLANHKLAEISDEISDEPISSSIDNLLNELQIKSRIIEIYMAIQLADLTQYTLNKYGNGRELRSVIRVTLGIDKHILITLVNPLNKDKKGNTVFNILNLRSGFNLVTEKIRDRIESGQI